MDPRDQDQLLQDKARPCSRCRLPLHPARKDNYCPDCRSEYSRAYTQWVKDGRPGRCLPSLRPPKTKPQPNLGPKPPRKGSESWASRSIKVSEHVSIYDGARQGQHQIRMGMKKRQKILAEQDGRCALCQKEIFIRPAKGQPLAELDHDHQPPYAVRGYLCSMCNRGIGMLQDDPDLLEAAAAYIRRHREPFSSTLTA